MFTVLKKKTNPKISQFLFFPEGRINRFRLKQNIVYLVTLIKVVEAVEYSQ